MLVSRVYLEERGAWWLLTQEFDEIPQHMLWVVLDDETEQAQIYDIEPRKQVIGYISKCTPLPQQNITRKPFLGSSLGYIDIEAVKFR